MNLKGVKGKETMKNNIILWEIFILEALLSSCQLLSGSQIMQENQD